MENGGPLASPRDFFTQPEAEELFRRRIRYIAARWGYATNILAWELWNEVDLAEQPPLSALVQWHADMADTLLSLDPYGRPITTSLSSTSPIVDMVLGSRLYGPLWYLPQIDLVQLHAYSIGPIHVDVSEVLPALVKTLWSYGKPVLIAEAGVDFRGPAETIEADPESVGFHDMLWSGIFCGTIGTGMTWWWDNVIDPGDLYVHFSPLCRFLGSIALDRESFEPAVVEASAPGVLLHAYGLRGETATLVWIKNASHQWFHPDHSLVQSASASIAGLGNSGWTARWFDTYTGDTPPSSDVLTTDGALEIAVPPFERDIALRLDRRF